MYNSKLHLLAYPDRAFATAPYDPVQQLIGLGFLGSLSDCLV